MITEKPEKSFRILSIDGGGFRGVYSAHLLNSIESKLNINLLDTFDLIAGTSTGSIIAAGIACSIPVSTILQLYKDHGRRIFCKRAHTRLPFISGLFASKYHNNALKEVLKNTFGDRTLGDIRKPLIIPSTDIGNGCVHVFKSKYDEGFVRDPDVLVRDAVLASCSAPTYFDPYKLKEYLLVDGGLWANNPSLVAAIDARKRLKIDLDRLKILSVGTGTVKQYYPQKVSLWKRPCGWGFITRWGRGKLIDTLLYLQASAASNMVGLLLNADQIMNLNFETDVTFALDNTKMQNDLISKADREFTYKSDEIKAFLETSEGVQNVREE
ncbi:MAG: CBASS cGAMP-activated phospholipase [Nitrospiraceae bacterium]|nr:CBASS cGAMP-activated phospholipase [Nitrospiraceae bacterium]